MWHNQQTCMGHGHSESLELLPLLLSPRLRSFFCLFFFFSFRPFFSFLCFFFLSLERFCSAAEEAA